MVSGLSEVEAMGAEAVFPGGILADQPEGVEFPEDVAHGLGGESQALCQGGGRDCFRGGFRKEVEDVYCSGNGLNQGGEAAGLEWEEVVGDTIRAP